MNLNKSCFPAWAAVLLLLCSTPFVTSGIAPEKKTRILLVAQHDPTYRLPSDVAYSVIDALDPERTGLPAEINAISNAKSLYSPTPKNRQPKTTKIEFYIVEFNLIYMQI